MKGVSNPLKWVVIFTVLVNLISTSGFAHSSFLQRCEVTELADINDLEAQTVVTVDSASLFYQCQVFPVDNFSGHFNCHIINFNRVCAVRLKTQILSLENSVACSPIIKPALLYYIKTDDSENIFIG
jgi:hypothetical protein